MRAAVIVPPIRDFYFTPHRFSALGAMIVHNILKNNKIDCPFYCFPLDAKKRSAVNLPQELGYLQRHIIPTETGRTSYFTKYKHFGPSFQECAAVISSLRPEICFLSVFAYAYADQAIELAHAIKAGHCPCTIVAGGAGASVHPTYFIRHPCIDFVLTGEAEVNLQAFVDIYGSRSGDCAGVPGCYWKDNGRIVANAPAALADEKQILPSWSPTIVRHEIPYVSLSLSRGCTKKCRFCSSALVHGRTFRKVPLDRVESLIESMSIDGTGEKTNCYINLEDDNLLLDPPFLLNVMKALKRKFPSCSFSMENGIDYQLMTEELTDRLASLGMRQFNISLGSVEGRLIRSPENLTKMTV
jgi:anaerobic magnesium-protoporphyrin IX monomethyl ester cyclase